jgi:hypothetical protein
MKQFISKQSRTELLIAYEFCLQSFSTQSAEAAIPDGRRSHIDLTGGIR